MRGGLIESGLDYCVSVTKPDMTDAEAFHLTILIQILDWTLDDCIVSTPVCLYISPSTEECVTKTEDPQGGDQQQGVSYGLCSRSRPVLPSHQSDDGTNQSKY